ncbi:MAG: hypothetical protein U0263_17585 [Polyangiaceae bacterium]
MSGRKVYDAGGKELTCTQPDRSCVAPEASTDFKDKCKLAGFRIMQCGCAMVCTGNASASEKQGYDAQNQAKACAEERKDCTPPETSAAFQDACSESGHKFMVCGCEWLCSGKLKAPVSTSPPAD